MALLLLVASAVCFVIALLISIAVLSGGNYPAWIAGGLLAYVLSLLAGNLPALPPRA